MIDIKKTYKNYVDGKYVRSESGKTYTKELKNEFYELPLTSRKDVRDTVTSSKSGFNKWNGLTPYTRMQILYRWLMVMVKFVTQRDSKTNNPLLSE